MKKLSFVLATLLGAGLATSAHAQSIRFGLKAGANLSNLTGNLTNQDRYKNKLGFLGGALLNVGLVQDLLSIQPEVLFSQKGFKYTNQTFGPLNYSGDRTYNYIDVPVLLKVKASGLFFEAGPQYSYLLNVRDNSTTTYNGTPIGNSSGTQNLDRVNRNEIGYAAGLGFEASSGVFIGVRYNGSFTDFAKEGYQDSDVRNARNSVFQASLGFLLPAK